MSKDTNLDAEERLNREIKATMELNEDIHNQDDKTMTFHEYLECLLWIKTGVIKDVKRY
tara:strand:- start:287 stop:463 length:177 start_codon:yes stop_codon:yes gene_type:complete